MEVKVEKIEQAKKKLAKYHQEHVWEGASSLSETEKECLANQILTTDFSVLDTLKQKETPENKQITPIEALTLAEIEKNKETYQSIGEKAILEGKVAAVLLAGGMGTRLGSDDPKGMYNIGLTRDVFIFQRLIENLLEVVSKIGQYVDLYVMTSEKNDVATRSFFAQKEYFGYDKDHVFFFMQETAPAVDYEGRIYMEDATRMATSPNGNGGWYTSLVRSEAGNHFKASNAQWLNVFAVDNVLQRIADPLFIGATIANHCMVGAKVIRKNAPDEKVGVMCLENGRPSIVEYYELTEEMRDAKNANGEPAYNFGVILNYLFCVEELDKIAGISLPLHKVEKKIPYMDKNGVFVKPEEPNGYKFEALVLDMIQKMESCLPYEVVREKEFAPIKNKTGKDSVESARELCMQNGIVL